MLRETEYPKGTFRSVDEVAQFIATGNAEVFYVHDGRFWDAPRDSFITSYTPFKIHFQDIGPFVMTSDCPGHRGFSLHDCNVIKNNYNDHFLFSNLPDAKTYIAYLHGQESYK